MALKDATSKVYDLMTLYYKKREGKGGFMKRFMFVVTMLLLVLSGVSFAEKKSKHAEIDPRDLTRAAFCYPDCEGSNCSKIVMRDYVFILENVRVTRTNNIIFVFTVINNTEEESEIKAYPDKMYLDDDMAKQYGKPSGRIGNSAMSDFETSPIKLLPKQPTKLYLEFKNVPTKSKTASLTLSLAGYTKNRSWEQLNPVFYGIMLPEREK